MKDVIRIEETLSFSHPVPLSITMEDMQSLAGNVFHLQNRESTAILPDTQIVENTKQVRTRTETPDIAAKPGSQESPDPMLSPLDASARARVIDAHEAIMDGLIDSPLTAEYRSFLMQELVGIESGAPPETGHNRLSVLSQLLPPPGYNPTYFRPLTGLIDSLINEPPIPGIVWELQQAARFYGDANLGRITSRSYINAESNRQTELGAMLQRNFQREQVPNRHLLLASSRRYPGMEDIRILELIEQPIDEELMESYRQLRSSPEARLNFEYLQLASRALRHQHMGGRSLTEEETDRLTALREFPENPRGQLLILRQNRLARVGQALSNGEQAVLDGLRRFPYNPRAAELARREFLSINTGTAFSEIERREIQTYESIEAERRRQVQEIVQQDRQRHDQLDQLNAVGLIGDDRLTRAFLDLEISNEVLIRARERRPVDTLDRLLQDAVRREGRSFTLLESARILNLARSSRRTTDAIRAGASDDLAVRQALRDMTSLERRAMQWGSVPRDANNPDSPSAVEHEAFQNYRREILQALNLQFRPLAERVKLENMALYQGGTGLVQDIERNTGMLYPSFRTIAELIRVDRERLQRQGSRQRERNIPNARYSSMRE